MEQNPKTLNEMLTNSVSSYGGRTAFKVKKDNIFEPISYEEFYNKIKSFGTGLLAVGIKKSDHIGIISDNRLEWIVSSLAITGLRAADVPMPGSTGYEDISFKLNHSDSKAVIYEGEKQLSEFYNVEKDLPEIKNIILFDKVNMFAKKGEHIPEWANQSDFEENKKINKEFYSKVKSLINNRNKNIILSPDAKKYLEKYLDENTENLLKKNNEKTGSSVKENILKRAIVVDKKYNKEHSHSIFSFDEITKKGKNLLNKGNTLFADISKSAEPDDLITIIYTSGTTGNPKGVMLTNKNFMHNIKNAPPAIGINKEDNLLSVLPSWHIYERIVEYCTISVGASTAYSKPFKQILLPDLKAEKPTLMCSVPRIWESLHKGIKDNVNKSSSIKRFMFNMAINVGEEYKEAERILDNKNPLFDRLNYTPEELEQARRTVKRLGWKYKLADKLVFKKIREVTGGNLRFAISAGGALTESTDIFFNTIGIRVCEGYGLTETSPVLTGRTEKEDIIFTVGAPIPGVKIKIVDKDNYSMELPNGKVGIVLTKGEMVMKGYYKNPEKTDEVIKDGWFNTGDLGKKTYNGKYLKLVGRIKDTIVLRGGENIEPLVLEDKLNESNYIHQVIVVGQDKSRLGALIVPDKEKLKEYAKNNNIEYKNIEELIQSKEIISLFQEEQKRLVSKERGFKPYESVMGVSLLPKEFTIEAGDLTETLKMKRFEIHKKYKQDIDRICG